MTEPTAGLWERFEAQVSNDRVYADPYRDVTLTVEYTRPDGTSVSFWGFYDGGTTWKLRWMPDQTGVWSFRARFSDGSPGLDGRFTCLPSSIPGIISVDEGNPLWFGFRGGEHFFARSLHVGDCFFAKNMPDEQRTDFLDWAQAQGYNMLSIGSHYLNRAEPGRGIGWDTPRLWPLDAGEFQKAERVLDDLMTRRIVVFPFGGFFGRGSNYPKSEADQDLYIRYVLARFGAYWNVLLNVSGPEPLLVKDDRVWIEFAELARMGQKIRSLDPFGHLLTVHNKTGDDEFLQEDWIDFGTLQGPKTLELPVLYDGLMRNHHPRRPLYAQETLWSGNKYHPQYDDEQLRRNAIVLNMAASTINFVDNGGPDPALSGDSSSGFSGTLRLDDRRQWRHDILKNVWDFFASIPFYRMSPCPSLLVSGSGYVLADEGKDYLVYLPECEPVELKVKDGPYQVEWINARDTAIRQPGQQGSDLLKLIPPSDGGDWFARITLL